MQEQFNKDWVSPDRFAEYLVATGNDVANAKLLYEWNAAVSAALFEVIHHVEVLLRNAIVNTLEREHKNLTHLVPGTPWIQNHAQVIEASDRLKKNKKPVTSGRVYSSLTFGFWKIMFGKGYDELWIAALQYVFKHSRADRSTIAGYLESIGQLRNRIAHHGSLLDFDTEIELKKLIRLASWIDPGASNWISGLERVTKLSGERPIVPERNVLLVPATDTWTLYEQMGAHAYICPPERSFRNFEYIGFYADQEIKPKIALVIHQYDAVDFNHKNAKRLRRTGDEFDAKLGSVIGVSMSKMNASGIHRVFLLSGPTDSATITLDTPIAHGKRGKGSAFAQRSRYFAKSQLTSAKDTDDL
ncbi:Abi family protein [Glutamicibacter sp.]|uniref:Abi family protein n=1 Tax=Glutamicibacter sp. TaxID=1931995 RepID=UPI003D6C39A2